ncbi:hypothetical protein BD289DRAFT_439439 [Coniella lustricola]|uniref:Uncharacterized protein n=1 Tax=Coniella lustricola TaxID=2025994 RepID=A0A2T3A1L9_9PEZI|nr:hypothetical protein BD289DRAFT_439439 [Coniella lustricola]
MSSNLLVSDQYHVHPPTSLSCPLTRPDARRDNGHLQGPQQADRREEACVRASLDGYVRAHISNVRSIEHEKQLWKRSETLEPRAQLPHGSSSAPYGSLTTAISSPTSPCQPPLTAVESTPQGGRPVALQTEKQDSAVLGGPEDESNRAVSWHCFCLSYTASAEDTLRAFGHSAFRKRA